MKKIKIGFLLFAIGLFSGSLFAQSPPASHSAVLSWQAYTQGTDQAVGFDVFRIVKGSSGNWTLLNSSPVAVNLTSYTDLTVSTGVDYLYYITAVDASGNQSNPSTTWDSGVVPGPLAVSGTLTGVVH